MRFLREKISERIEQRPPDSRPSPLKQTPYSMNTSRTSSNATIRKVGGKEKKRIDLKHFPMMN
jgi:hypothetical protein